MTATVRLDGEEGLVLEQATRLLRVVERLDGARLLSLRIEYDSSSDGDTPSPREAELWRLALRAAATADRPATPS